MTVTPISLLDRLRHEPAESDWQRLVDLYTPLLQDLLSRRLASRSEVDDLVQDIWVTLVQKLPTHERTGRFRSWLFAIVANRVYEFWRKRRVRPIAPGGDEGMSLLAEIADSAAPLNESIELEYNRYILRRLLELIEPEFRPDTWKAFQRHVIDGLTPVETALELGVSPGAVLIAKSRILKRLRQEAAGFVDGGLEL